MEEESLQVKEPVKDSSPKRRLQDVVECDLCGLEQLLEVVHVALCLACSDQAVSRPLPDGLGGPPYPPLEHREPHQLEEVARLVRF